MSEERRLFFAINIPEGIREKIYSGFSSDLPDGCKVVAKENLHITLKFIGYMGDAGIGELEERVSSINFPKFRAVLKGIGSFGNRVVWVGVDGGMGKLEKLSGEVNRALSTQEERFHPHVTIARNRFLKRNELDGIIGGMNKKEFAESFEVNSFDLMESHLSREGPRYELLFRKELV